MKGVGQAISSSVPEDQAARMVTDGEGLGLVLLPSNPPGGAGVLPGEEVEADSNQHAQAVQPNF